MSTPELQRDLRALGVLEIPDVEISFALADRPALRCLRIRALRSRVELDDHVRRIVIFAKNVARLRLRGEAPDQQSSNETLPGTCTVSYETPPRAPRTIRRKVLTKRCAGRSACDILFLPMKAVQPIRWEDAFRAVIPQINADGLLEQQFDSTLPLQVRFYAYDARRDYRLCRHHYFELFYLSSGEALFRLGERTFPMRTGDLIVVNSTHYHNIEPARKSANRAVHGVLLYFQPEIFRGAVAAREDLEYLEPFLQQDGGFPHVVPAETRTPALIYDLMRLIANELPARTARSRLTAKTYLRMILVHLLNHYSAYRGASDSFEHKHRQIERLDPLFRYLDLHYAEPVTLDDAAHLAGMSKSHFIHFIKQVTGMSFIAYLNQFRVSKAQALMASTNKSLAEISHEVGFCDQSYFGQVFRKLLKTTPRDYRLQLDLSGR